jgi:hypothetical protein
VSQAFISEGSAATSPEFNRRAASPEFNRRTKDSESDRRARQIAAHDRIPLTAHRLKMQSENNNAVLLRFALLVLRFFTLPCCHLLVFSVFYQSLISRVPNRKQSFWGVFLLS